MLATATGSGAAKAGRTALIAATLFMPFQPAQVHIGPRSAIEGATLTLLSSDVLIMSGNYMPEVSPEWMEFVARNFIEPTIGTGYVNTPVATNGQWWPFTGLTSMSLNDSTRAGSEILDSRINALISSNQVAGTPDDPIAVLGYSGVLGAGGGRKTKPSRAESEWRSAAGQLHNALGFHPP